MSRAVIAVIADCDGILSADTTSVLLRHLGIDQQRFWQEISALVGDGWYPHLTYLSQIVTY